MRSCCGGRAAASRPGRILKQSRKPFASVHSQCEDVRTSARPALILRPEREPRSQTDGHMSEPIIFVKPGPDILVLGHQRSPGEHGAAIVLNHWSEHFAVTSALFQIMSG